jgi:hypothetical protein
MPIFRRPLMRSTPLDAGDHVNFRKIAPLVAKAFTSTILPELIKAPFLLSRYFRVFQHNRPQGDIAARFDGARRSTRMRRPARLRW